jgi:hypothetical protein
VKWLSGGLGKLTSKTIGDEFAQIGIRVTLRNKNAAVFNRRI